MQRSLKRTMSGIKSSWFHDIANHLIIKTNNVEGKNLEGGPREVSFLTFSKVTNEPQQLPQGRNPPQKLKEGPPSRP